MSNNLSLALQSMPHRFTSNEFTKQCRKMGMQEMEIASPVITPHLQSSCIRLTQRTWEKKESNNTTLFAEQELTEDRCVQFLKERGYKITKVIEIQM